MTPEQQLRLKARRVPLRTRNYVRLMDQFNHTDEDRELRRLTDRTSALLKKMTNDEFAHASFLLRTMDREDALKRRL